MLRFPRIAAIIPQAIIIVITLLGLANVMYAAPLLALVVPEDVAFVATKVSNVPTTVTFLQKRYTPFPEKDFPSGPHLSHSVLKSILVVLAIFVCFIAALMLVFFHKCRRDRATSQAPSQPDNAIGMVALTRPAVTQHYRAESTISTASTRVGELEDKAGLPPSSSTMPHVTYGRPARAPGVPALAYFRPNH